MVFTYVEHNAGYYNKLSYETVTYAKYIADKINQKLVVFSVNPISSASELYKFGANKVIELRSEGLKIFDASLYAKVLMNHFTNGYYIFTHSNESASIAAFFSIKKNIPLITNLIRFPSKINPFIVKRKSFSGKAIMNLTVFSDSILLTILPNSIGCIENVVEGEVEISNISVENSKLLLDRIEKMSFEKVSLKAADIVVSAGRGLKSPENWGIIERLAKKLGAAIACSKPVSDLGWRPHSEHVGQTGKTIAPIIYLAIGISGAIQHIAGVNQSNIIVVINSDPEAPFFKSADYGIIGDAFEIIPKIIQLLEL